MDHNPIHIFPLARKDKGFVIATIILLGLLSTYGLYYFGFQIYHYGTIDLFSDPRITIHTVVYLGTIIFLIAKKPKKQALILFEDGLEICEINRIKLPSRSIEKVMVEKINILNVFGCNQPEKSETKLSFNFQTKEGTSRNIEISSPPHSKDEILAIMDHILETSPLEKQSGAYYKGDINSPFFNLSFSPRCQAP
jgi:hypothetical protein